uniref:Uncharacterized protein n=1 Tax=viral metagenome TaxID=1070528 RepID=A0A6C0C9Z9_9ZZZZ
MDEILGWDIVNLILTHLGPREIILISTSINSNFCERTKSKIYTDHILLNQQHNFENRQPAREILGFHMAKKKNIDDSYYVKICAKDNSYADLLEKMIELDKGFPTYIDAGFGSTTNFLKKSYCEITPYGDGFDKIIIKIELPKLPDGVKYVDSPHDLINEIELEFSSSIFFRYTSFHFKHLDFITQLFTDNVVYFYIDLSLIFKSEGSSFSGVRIYNIYYHYIRFYVRLNDIFSIIENKIDYNSQLYHEINILSIDDALLLVKYHKLQNIDPMSQLIKQKTNKWIVIDHSFDMYETVHEHFGWYKINDPITIKKITLLFDQKIMLDNCSLTINDCYPNFIVVKPTNDCPLDKYVFFPNLKVISRNIARSDIRRGTYLGLKVILHDINVITVIYVSVFVEIEGNFMYQDGMVTWDV